MTVIEGVAKVNVSVGDSESRRVISLPFEKDTEGNQLISATVDSEKGANTVIAMIQGERHTLKQDVTQFVTEIVDQRPSGPSTEDVKRHESLSEAAKLKFKDEMRALFADEKFRNSPSEERKKVIHSVFEQIEKEDKPRSLKTKR
ncbi:MAG: hypothetical protein NTV80_11460 [Verrucomicrobia bacterium]|nr:hypothetical protein [Verrucomicrobiota bacterium]